MNKHEGTVSVKIATRNIGPDYPPFIVAEISSNHGGSVAMAKDLVLAAKEAGAHAIKIQCYTADSICAKGIRRVNGGLWDGQDLYELYQKSETPPMMAREILTFAQANKITCFSSVFDLETVDFLVGQGVPAIKIASFELVDTPLITKAASSGLPIIISTGMGCRDEIKAAVNAVKIGRQNRRSYELALLHCVSNYPADPKDANLGMLGPLSDMIYGKPIVGFSDHTLGFGTACAAVAFGASIIEKHFILDRHSDVPDAAFSMEPAEFRQLVTSCREAWEASYGHQSRKGYLDQGAIFSTSANLDYRKSLWLSAPVRTGEAFSPSNVRILRPANGLSPYLYGSVLAGVATRDLQPETGFLPLCRDMVSTLS
jgi:N-acetylneuraminate synthase